MVLVSHLNLTFCVIHLIVSHATSYNLHKRHTYLIDQVKVINTQSKHLLWYIQK